MGNIANALPYFPWLPDDIEANDRGGPARRRKQSDEHLDGRALAGTVRPEQTKYGSRSDAKRQMVNGYQLAKPPRQIDCLNGRRGVRGDPINGI